MAPITLPNTTDIDQQAADLTRHLLDNYDPESGAGFMSATVYDTAWLALIQKPSASGQRQWLFPKCFQYILDTQLADGGWEAYRSEVDGILNTTASLLALSRHASEPLQIEFVSIAEVEHRIERATAALLQRLSVWDVAETTHVGFEIIVPTMLRLLKEQGISFEFHGESFLMDMYAAKMSRFRPEYLYGKTQHTALHSLEAFMGQIDYTKVAHHKVGGAIMASPSSTAAYLIGLPGSAWDDEAENYLAAVLKTRDGTSVPSAFPSTNFEFSWVLSTLLQAGFSAKQLGPSVTKIGQMLTEALETGHGVVGFAPTIMADVDDTAKTLSAINHLGIPRSAAKMIENFETKTHFRTYPSERDSSFSANCNVLLALLHQPEPAESVDQISKVLGFLCNVWWKTNGPIKDKWNLSPLYPSMLLVEALVDLLELVERGSLPESLLSKTEIRTKIAVALFQAATRTIEEQESAGSWNNSVEETAYAVILLSVAARVTLFDPIRQQLINAVRKAQEWLQPVGPIESGILSTGNYLWIEKVTYGSPVLTQAYRLAALRSALFIPAASTVGDCLNIAAPTRQSEGFVKLYRLTPLFSDFPEHKLGTTVVEGSLFLPMLREYAYNVFTRENMTEDKYLTIIPFTWTGCCMRVGLKPSAEFLWEMMMMAVMGFQGDEFVEAVAGPAFAGNLDQVRRFVRNLIPIEPGEPGEPSEELYGSAELEILKPLELFRDFMLDHWAVTAATSTDRNNLARELRSYLLTQIQQSEDNARFVQDGAGFRPDASYLSWVRTTSADHTSAPTFFAFLACLIPQTICPSLAGSDCFPTAEEKYFAGAACRHLASMCRMYNDFGSVSRDVAEGNLNSLDFPEFNSTVADTKKEAMWELAQFERACLQEAFARLERAARKRVAGLGEKSQREIETWITCWRMFCDVTDLYGQIYVVRDMASNVVRPAR
ncbi:hypothetical protein MCOR25_008332 [Pyricularia grisea]|nr:hypothetical protein MCOR25_008332 [Pyricularia grisea]